MEQYEAEHGKPELAILARELPLYNARHAEFLQHEVPGINISEGIRQGMRVAGDRGATEGVAMARDLVLQPLVQGIYLMLAFGHYDLAAEVIEALN